MKRLYVKLYRQFCGVYASPSHCKCDALLNELRPQILGVFGLEPKLSTNLVRSGYKSDCATLHYTPITMRGWKDLHFHAPSS